MIKSVNKQHKGVAYIMVIIAAMAMLMLSATVLLITASSRTITSRYDHFLGLFDLAVAGNEQALHLLNHGVNANRETIKNNITQQVLDNTEDSVVFYNREFYTAHAILINEAKPFALASLQQYFSVMGLHLGRRWEFSVIFSSLTGLNIEDRYQAATTIASNSVGFTVSTEISKFGENGFSNPATVEANIVWNLSGFSFLPQFTWAAMPEIFGTEISPNVIITDLIDISLLDFLNNEDAFIILTDDEAILDVSEFATSIAIVHTGSNLHITASNMANNNLRGILISFGNINFYNAHFLGNVWAAGDIYTNSSILLDAYAIFDVEFSPPGQQYFFDFLRISNFSTAGNSSDISYALGFLTINDIKLRNYLDDYALTMVELVRIVD